MNSPSQHPKVAGPLVIRPTGRLDGQTAPRFTEWAAGPDALGSNPASAVVDLSGLDYISSAGLRSLLQIANAAKAGGVELEVCNPNEQVGSVLEVSGFDKLLGVKRRTRSALRRLMDAVRLKDDSAAFRTLDSGLGAVSASSASDAVTFGVGIGMSAAAVFSSDAMWAVVTVETVQGSTEGVDVATVAAGTLAQLVASVCGADAAAGGTVLESAVKDAAERAGSGDTSVSAAMWGLDTGVWGSTWGDGVIYTRASDGVVSVLTGSGCVELPAGLTIVVAASSAVQKSWTGADDTVIGPLTERSERTAESLVWDAVSGGLQDVPEIGSASAAAVSSSVREVRRDPALQTLYMPHPLL